MGAGKTTIGLHLAGKLGISFLDSDKEIEAQAGASISEVFERDGEEFFRKVEAKVISEILGHSNPLVLATGGGAYMNAATREVVAKNSVSVWLNAGIETLLERVETNNNRPLLNTGNRRETLQRLIDERYATYAKADIIVDTDSNSRTMVANKIIRELEVLWKN